MTFTITLTATDGVPSMSITSDTGIGPQIGVVPETLEWAKDKYAKGRVT